MVSSHIVPIFFGSLPAQIARVVIALIAVFMGNLMIRCRCGPVPSFAHDLVNADVAATAIHPDHDLQVALAV